VSLNIKNERVHALAREAARITGKTQTSAMEEALTLLLEKYGDRHAERERTALKMRIRERAAEARRAEDDLPPSEIMTPEDLYDPETGLPW
jgi:antitoxin VapB